MHKAGTRKAVCIRHTHACLWVYMHAAAAASAAALLVVVLLLGSHRQAGAEARPVLQRRQSSFRLLLHIGRLAQRAR